MEKGLGDFRRGRVNTIREWRKQLGEEKANKSYNISWSPASFWPQELLYKVNGDTTFFSSSGKGSGLLVIGSRLLSGGMGRGAQYPSRSNYWQIKAILWQGRAAVSLANTQQSCRMGELAGEGVLRGAPAASHVTWEISWVISLNPQNLTIDGVKFRGLTEINTQFSYFLFSILIPPPTNSFVSSPGDHFTFLCISSYATTYDADAMLWVLQPCWFLKQGFSQKSHGSCNQMSLLPILYNLHRPLFKKF